jgi:Protein of unknown function (DUF4240)
VTLAEDEFWRLIGLLWRSGNVDRLADELRRRPGAEILGFFERLRAAVAALDSEAHRQHSVMGGGDGAQAVLSEDGFEDLRLAVVAGGRDRWRTAVADPSTLTDGWPQELGEELGIAAATAYEVATGDPWPNLVLSVPSASPETSLPPTSLQAWLLLMPLENSDAGSVVLPAAYMVQLEWLEKTLNRPAWWDRWNAIRGAGSHLDCFLEYGTVRGRRSGVHVGRDYAGREEVTVTVRVEWPEAEKSDPAAKPLPVSSTDSAGWAALARAHVELVLDVLATKLGIRLPPLPPPAELERQRLGTADREK